MRQHGGMNESTRRGYDLVAARYAAECADELRGKPLERGLLDAFAEVTAGGPVLDIGCGPGQTSAYLAGRGAQVIGVDLSPVMCSIGHDRTALAFIAADMCALPIRSAAASGILCWYALIHLDPQQRTAAYAEFARVLRPGGHAMVAFHTSDAETGPGQAKTVTDWWGQPVELVFRYLDPVAEIRAMASAGLRLVARVDRAPYEGAEYPSQRSCLLVRVP